MVRVVVDPTQFSPALSGLPALLPYSTRVFVNRTVRLDRIRAIGFDMDYTLAIYRAEAERLAATLAAQRLVHYYRYPAQLLQDPYQPGFAARGLVIDTFAGNIFKMDAHKHVDRVYHGTRLMTKDERRKTYRAGAIRLGSSRYVSLDTLFELPEAYLFARLVDLEDQAAHRNPLSRAKYGAIYRDVRESIDCIHRDGSLKSAVLKDVDRYLEKDVKLPITLARWKDAGKALFVVTNSEWAYTEAVLSTILSGPVLGQGTILDLFDIVVASAQKPDFFRSRTSFERVDTKTGLVSVEPGPIRGPGFYQHGNVRDFARGTLWSEDDVLYIGDHIYGDMRRSKKATAWRTAMIVPEMEQELAVTEQLCDRIDERNRLETQRREIDDEMIQTQLKLEELVTVRRRNLDGEFRNLDEWIVALERELDSSRRRMLEINERVKKCSAEIDDEYSSTWGPLFKSRGEHSAFGAQVEDYACVYTSRVSNFSAYSPNQYFRTPRDFLPHERVGNG